MHLFSQTLLQLTIKSPSKPGKLELQHQGLGQRHATAFLNAQQFQIRFWDKAFNIERLSELVYGVLLDIGRCYLKQSIELMKRGSNLRDGFLTCLEMKRIIDKRGSQRLAILRTCARPKRSFQIGPTQPRVGPDTVMV